MAEEDRAEEDPRHLLRQETEEDTEVRLLRRPEEAVGMSRPEADVKAGMNRLMAEDTAVLLRDAGTEEAPRPRRFCRIFCISQDDRTNLIMAEQNFVDLNTYYKRMGINDICF